MRTVIFLGLLAIADSINKDWSEPKYTPIFACVFIASITMDVIDFVIKNFKDK